MKVLLVEDHPAVAKISCDLLQEIHGHEVVYAATGSDALEAAAAEPPDLVLLDLNLPDMSGYEVAERLRAESRFSRTAVVILTGFGDEIDSKRVAALGVDAYFRKPMDFDRLEQLMRH